MEFLIAYGYIGVFIASFLAATILPFSSEVVLTGVLLAGSAYWPCMIAATLGNFLGGMSCYWLGMLGKVEWIEKYLKLDPVKLQKVQDWIKGKGSWMGFFVFLPGIGDFIAVALGFLRANIWVVAISMFLGKAIRYWVWMEFVYKVQVSGYQNMDCTLHEIISSVIVPFSVNLIALSIKFVIELQGFLYMNSASLEVFFVRKELIPACKCLPGEDRQ